MDEKDSDAKLLSCLLIACIVGFVLRCSRQICADLCVLLTMTRGCGQTVRRSLSNLDVLRVAHSFLTSLVVYHPTLGEEAQQTKFCVLLCP